jgi:hypothetical protein
MDWAVKFQLAYTMAEKKKLGLSRHYGYLWLLFSAAGCKK